MSHMKLIIVTQKVDKEDENLGAFYYWFAILASRAEELVIIADSVGETNFPANVKICELGKNRGYTSLHRLFRLWEFFWKHYRRSDAVFFHQIPEHVIAAAPFLFLWKKKTAFWYAHKSVTNRLKLAEKLVDYIFTSSEAGFRLPSKKVFYVGQAINTELFKPRAGRALGDNMLKLVTIGRIAPVKNYEIIINACAILKDTWKEPWRFSIVGGPIFPRDQEYLSALKKLVQDKGLTHFVEFLGSKPYSAVPEILQEHDFFLNVSATGSLDKAVFEAMACGLTVLTANEAYRSILPPRYFLAHTSPVFLAERIKALAGEARPNVELRSIVLEHHSLEKTIDRIFRILTESQYSLRNRLGKSST